MLVNIYTFTVEQKYLVFSSFDTMWKIPLATFSSFSFFNVTYLSLEKALSKIHPPCSLSIKRKYQLQRNILLSGRLVAGIKSCQITKGQMLEMSDDVSFSYFSFYFMSCILK